METPRATAASPVSPERTHLRHIEGMRAAAALIVYVNHAYAQIWNPGFGLFPSGALAAFSYFLIYGHLSVTVFIVISGFCLTLPVVAARDRIAGGAAVFFRRRALRILPPYYAAAALCLILIGTVLGQPTGTIWDAPIRLNHGSILSHSLLLQDFYGTGSINYVFWSIAVEWQIYFLFPLLVAAWRRYGPAFTVLAALITGYGLWFVFSDTRIARANPQYLGMFALGMFAAYVVKSSAEPYARLRQKLPWFSMAIACFAVTLASSFALGYQNGSEQYRWLDLPVGIMAACALVASSGPNPSVLTRIFAYKPLVFVGTFSYSLYLVHAPLLQLIWQYVLRKPEPGNAAHFAFLMTVGLAAILGVSYLFFRVCEQPFIRAGAARRVRAVPQAALEQREQGSVARL